MMDDRRDAFLMHVYDQAHGNINRQFGYVWQSAGLVATAVAVFAYAEEKRIALEVPTCLFLVLAGWYSAHLIDTNLWFNRNLLILANVERQFLVRSDLRDIHHFFREHRKNNRMLSHLRIQLLLVSTLSLAVLGNHALKVYAAEAPSKLSPIPYVLALTLLTGLVAFWWRARADYNDLRVESPGCDLKD